MMFDQTTIKAIQDGKKTVTRRLLRKDGKRPATVGRTQNIKVDRTKKRYGKIKIIDVRQEPLKNIMQPGEAEKEGFNSVEEYLKYFTIVNGTNDWDKIVWRIEFEVVENPCNYENIGVIMTGDPQAYAGRPTLINAEEIAHVADLESTLEDMMWDLSKYECNFIVLDGEIKENEFVITINEHNPEYHSDIKPSTIKEFKKWISNEECDWFYTVNKITNVRKCNDGSKCADVHFNF